MLDNKGKIPPHTECPWRDSCPHQLNLQCHHTGKMHKVAFSCSLARGFELVDKIRKKPTPLQLNLV